MENVVPSPELVTAICLVCLVVGAIIGHSFKKSVNTLKAKEFLLQKMKEEFLKNVSANANDKEKVLALVEEYNKTKKLLEQL